MAARVARAAGENAGTGFLDSVSVRLGLRALAAAFRQRPRVKPATSRARTWRSNIAGPTVDIDRLPDAGGRSGPPPGERDRRDRRHARGVRRQGGHLDDPDRLRRSATTRSSSASSPASNRPGGNVDRRTNFFVASWRRSGWACCASLCPSAARVGCARQSERSVRHRIQLAQTLRRRRARSGYRSRCSTPAAISEIRRGLRDPCAAAGAMRSVVGADAVLQQPARAACHAGGAPCDSRRLSRSASSPRPAG